MKNMNKRNINECEEIFTLSEDELECINGGAFDVWRTIAYCMGVTAAIHEVHAETAPWVAFGSK